MGTAIRWNAQAVGRILVAVCVVWVLVSVLFLRPDDDTPQRTFRRNRDDLEKFHPQQPTGGGFAIPEMIPILQRPVNRMLDSLNIRREEPDRNIIPPPIHEQLRRAAVDPNAPGELGKAVNIEKENLSPDERKKFDDGFQNNAFNEYASKMISVHRSLPDIRDEECKTIKYADNLPTTSIVMCFHNEAWSVLLRSVHSIIDRTDPKLLVEVILVDDFSDQEHLKDELQEYMDKLRIVKIVRMKQREGLIRSRLAGAKEAQGDVITFLDSHIECAEGWLEPLLDEIKKDESNVVTPVIDVIDDTTLQYHYGSAKHTSVGGFDWNLQFNWHPIPAHENSRRATEVSPIHSPTMAGGLFSISKSYFVKIGTYDAGMDIWGGENLEMSFRIWMCGGILEIAPCSHVGHIFRKRSPYKWKDGENVVRKNSVRLAEVWMDDYKNYYYERINHDLGNYGDVSSRKKLRTDLECKSFDWYIRTIYPDLFIPKDALYSGEIRNEHVAYCLDSTADHHSYNKPVKMWPCHNQGGNQYWLMSKQGEIRRDEACFDYTGKDTVNMYMCHGQGGNQKWTRREDGLLQHQVSNKCMAVSSDGKTLSMEACDPSKDTQRWKWNRGEGKI